MVPTQDTPLQGLYNAVNVMVAVALCEAIGPSRETSFKHIKTFQGLSYRVEKIGEKNGAVFIDNSKGTSIGVVTATIAGLQNPFFAISGGMGKGQGFTSLRDTLVDKARGVFLIGVGVPQIRCDLNGCNLDTTDCATLEGVVQAAYAQIGAGDIVLFSPVCASFDMFRGYVYRSEIFTETFKAS